MRLKRFHTCTTRQEWPKSGDLGGSFQSNPQSGNLDIPRPPPPANGKGTSWLVLLQGKTSQRAGLDPPSLSCSPLK